MQYKIRAILKYVEWYRRQYNITIGSVHDGGDDISANAELIEQLARATFPNGPWNELQDHKTLDELYSCVVSRVA